MEAVKPLVVLVLFGTILYGAYSIVQKGPAQLQPASHQLPEAPPFAPPAVQPETPAVTAAPAAAAPQPPAQPPVLAVPQPPAAQAAADPTPTYLAAESAPPPTAEPRPDRFAALPPAQLPPPTAVPAVPAPAASPSPQPGAPSAAFASAWTDAHDKLAANRYAEALAALSVWHDDPSLGLEESQRLEELLGQLAGTVIYSQQDLMLPPHVVAPGETLPTIALALGVSPQLLAKINGVDDPSRLVPGEHIKVIRGPFDAVVSVSRRRLSLQLNGNYAGSFSAVVGRQFLDRVGGSLPVVEVARGGVAGGPGASLRRGITLGDGLVIEAVDDPGVVSDNAPQSSLVVSVRDLDDLIDILGPGSRVLVRQ